MHTQIKVASRHGAESEIKKPYSQPKLIEYGDINEVTEDQADLLSNILSATIL